MTDWKNVLYPISPPNNLGHVFFLEALLLIIAHSCILFQCTLIIPLKCRNEYQLCKGRYKD